MSPTEAAALLAMAATFDNRKPDPAAATAWATVLDGLRPEDCRQAVIEHYRDHTEWLMPAMVRTAVRRIRTARIIAYGTLPDPPAGLDPDNAHAYARWLADIRRQIADGNPPPRALGPADDDGQAA